MGLSIQEEVKIKGVSGREGGALLLSTHVSHLPVKMQGCIHNRVLVQWKVKKKHELSVDISSYSEIIVPFDAQDFDWATRLLEMERLACLQTITFNMYKLESETPQPMHYAYPKNSLPRG